MTPCGIRPLGAFHRRFIRAGDDARHHFTGWDRVVTRRLVLLAWLLLLPPRPLWGQVRIGLEHGREVLTGATRPRVDAPAGTASLRPWQPTWWGMRMEGPRRGIRPALTLRRGTPDLALAGDELTLIEHAKRTTLTALQAEAVLPILRRDGTEWQASLGGLLERWAFPGVAARWRLGPVAGASVVLPLAGPLEASLGGSVGLLPRSPFVREELPGTLEPRNAWRTALRGGVGLRFE